jgi:perosamine synthetase
LPKLAIDGGTPVRQGDPIPLASVSYGYEELAQVIDVFRSGLFCQIYEQAIKVKNFEKGFAQYVNAKHAVSFTSGTTAQNGSLTSVGVKEGDEVIVPALTFASTGYTVLHQRAVPVFADVTEETFNINPADVERRVSEKTKAIVVVHWLGHPADMEKLVAIAEENNAILIEDCAMALGSEHSRGKVGSFGKVSCWSLQETKIITAAGEGGVLTTNDDGIAERARMIRDHGKIKSSMKAGDTFYPGYKLVTLGNNYRLTEIQGAFALAQMQRLDDILTKRRHNYGYLHPRLTKVLGVFPQKITDFTRLLNGGYLGVRFDLSYFSKNLDQIAAALGAEGIVTYPIGRDECCLTQPIFEKFVNRPIEKSWPNASRIADELLLLPMHANLRGNDLEDIVVAVEKVAAGYAK